MFKIIKKTFFKEKAPANLGQNIEQDDQSLKKQFSDKIDKIFAFFIEKYHDIINEIKTIKDKLGNLPEVNHRLGLKHLENGHLSDAIFRFKFINKMWPERQDAYYYLAYCLYLKKQNYKAKLKLEELLKINPDYDSKAKELLEQINRNTPSAQ
jgi:tetratricopeptide (TPR) repeat protein